MSLTAIISNVGPTWGWLAFFGWIFYQLYWPFSQTKIQTFHEDMTTRLERIEIIQVALGEEVTDINENKIKDVHGQTDLSSSDLKTGEN